MYKSRQLKKVLILLIGEVLRDPRVYRTCSSLRDEGADVTVACTTPYNMPERENHKEVKIIRFPHRKEYFLKKTYNWIKDRIHPNLGNKLSSIHEEVPVSSVTAGIRNFVLGLNYRHFMKSNLKINLMMMKKFDGRSFDLVHCNDVDTLAAGS